eukprot:TRINITY_DN5321_c0_g1_i2.p1 TRINITY_DN5321_c0_g1~~TRINITY_DN5321_c0_g1_i2.p1  ORF type:complete len:140 (+),score=28.62 TRINITY_DN5321_c0_g1_i2:181-600(+)
MNPLLFGLEVKDSKAPYVTAIFAYPRKTGDCMVEEIKAHGAIGFGVTSNDKQDLAPNKNGVSNIQSFFNGNKSLEVDFKRFSFDETKHIKRYVDYEYYKSKKSKIQKLFIEKNNPLSLLKTLMTMVMLWLKTVHLLFTK